MYAVPAYPHPVKILQPDGSELIVQMHGDEHFHYHTTPDGYFIHQDSLGFFRYASLSANGKIKMSSQRVHPVDVRSQEEMSFLSSLTKNNPISQTANTRKAAKIASYAQAPIMQHTYPLTGKNKSLVILVNFSDKSYVTPVPKTAFTNLLNEEGYIANGSTGSALDYFTVASNGIFTPQFDVAGPYTLPQTLDYYGKNNSSDEDSHTQQMVIDACAAADAAGINFAQYDTDKDGFVDNIFIYYAGHNEAEGAPANTVWPHRWSLANYNTKHDGKIIFDYACTSELRGASGTNMCGIGTFCHEFGHVLGLVDYYHTTADKVTLNNWSIMDGGAYLNFGRTPPTYSAYDRFFLGWLKPTEIRSPQNVSLESVITSNKAVLVSQAGNHNLKGATPISPEFFIIENRQKVGFDTYLPASGLLIWHIDYLKSAWDDNAPNNYTETYQTASSHMRVYLQPLSGNSTTPGNAFKTGSFNPTLWDGTDLNKPITAIQEANSLLTFKFMGGNTFLEAPIAAPATDVRNGSFVANWNSVNNAKGYYLTLYGKSEGTTTYTEEFDKGLEAPIDWIINASGTTTSDSYSGIKIPAIQFKNNNDFIQTEEYPTTVIGLNFYVKNLNAINSNLLIEAWNETNWVKIDTFAISAILDSTLHYNFDSANNYKRFRINYLLNTGIVAIDDIQVEFSEAIHYVYKNKWIENTFDTAFNLVSERKHYYKIMASDVSFYADSTKVYEILSAYSNIMEVTTLPFTKTNVLRAERDFFSQEVLVFLANTKDKLYIYNAVGQVVAIIQPTDLKVNITNYLKPHNIYLLVAGTKFAKFIF